MSHFVSKATLTLIGSALITAAAYLPAPWSIVASAVGGLLGGSALIKRPGDTSPAKADS